MSSPVETRPTSPWHSGELALQASAGAIDRMAEVGRKVVRDHLIEQHRDFFPMLSFVVLGAVDAAGDAWATIRAGSPGFLRSPDPSCLAVELPRDPTDPADAGLGEGQAIALLGIDLTTRRRNRLNGTIRHLDVTGFVVDVEQSYGNCPRYIRVRHCVEGRDPKLPPPGPSWMSDRLDGRARAIVAEADTMFVATYAERGGERRHVDVSHRGGPGGFVRIGQDGVLTIPDFAGNNFFNTLGNVSVNPRTGLVFLDFATGDVVQLAGVAEVVLDSPEIEAFQGAERLWRVSPDKIVFRAEAFPLRFPPYRGDMSPDGHVGGFGMSP